MRIQNKKHKICRVNGEKVCHGSIFPGKKIVFITVFVVYLNLLTAVGFN